MKNAFIAREFHIDQPPTVHLRLYRPRRLRGGGYACEFAIHRGRRLIKRRTSRGEDGVQALLLALGLARACLEAYAKQSRIELADWQTADLKPL